MSRKNIGTEAIYKEVSRYAFLPTDIIVYEILSFLTVEIDAERHKIYVSIGSSRVESDRVYLDTAEFEHALWGVFHVWTRNDLRFLFRNIHYIPSTLRAVHDMTSLTTPAIHTPSTLRAVHDVTSLTTPAIHTNEVMSLHCASMTLRALMTRDEGVRQRHHQFDNVQEVTDVRFGTSDFDFEEMSDVHHALQWPSVRVWRNSIINIPFSLMKFRDGSTLDVDNMPTVDLTNARVFEFNCMKIYQMVLMDAEYLTSELRLKLLQCQVFLSMVQLSPEIQNASLIINIDSEKYEMPPIEMNLMPGISRYLTRLYIWDSSVSGLNLNNFPYLETLDLRYPVSLPDDLFEHVEMPRLRKLVFLLRNPISLENADAIFEKLTSLDCDNSVCAVLKRRKLPNLKTLKCLVVNDDDVVRWRVFPRLKKLHVITQNVSIYNLLNAGLFPKLKRVAVTVDNSNEPAVWRLVIIPQGPHTSMVMPTVTKVIVKNLLYLDCEILLSLCPNAQKLALFEPRPMSHRVKLSIPHITHLCINMTPQVDSVNVNFFQRDLTRLRELVIDGNVQIGASPDFPVSMHNLERIVVSQCDDMSELFSNIATLDKVDDLVLKRCTVAKDLIAKCTHLTKLELNHVNLDELNLCCVRYVRVLKLTELVFPEGKYFGPMPELVELEAIYCTNLPNIKLTGVEEIAPVIKRVEEAERRRRKWRDEEAERRRRRRKWWDEEAERRRRKWWDKKR